MVIDAHHHFWKYDPVEYDWINDEMSVIRKDFLPADLKKTIDSAGVVGVISVQARQTVEETRWLLDMAKRNSFIKGVTGWVPLRDKPEKILEELASEPHLRAVRHVLQGEPDGYMLDKDFNSGISLLKKYDLVYEILIFERQLKSSIELVKRHPDQVFVLDHIAKPRIKENQISPWKENIKELARYQNVFCKISGMVTEADYKTWTEDQLRPYLETVLDAFGPERLMFGSDWPVCLVACGYERWVNLVRRFMRALSLNEQAMIMGRNALIVYDL
jgi:L-fuconolactonase